MKHLKQFESKFKTVKSSELDNWSVDQALNKDKDKHLTGKKDLSQELGSKVIELLAEYRLFPSVTSSDWLKQHRLVLESEKNFKEFRVELGEKQSFEEWCDWEGIDYDGMGEEEQLKVEKDYDDIEPEERHGGLEFSIFLPFGVKDLESAMSDASKYLYALSNSLPEVYNDDVDSNGVLSNNPEGFKKFLSVKELKITNKNVEDVSMIEYRLYKDNKFFYNLEDAMGKHEMLELIERWLKLIK